MISTPVKAPSESKPVTAESPCDTEVSVSTEGGEEQNFDMLQKPAHGPGKVSSSSSSVHLLNHAFSISMTIVGVFDIMGTILPPYVINAFAKSEEALNEFEVDPYKQFGNFSQEFLTFVKWLDHHDITISFLFAVLWFANAFFDASILRNQALNEAERKRLWSNGEDDLDKQKTTFWHQPNVVYMRQIVLQLLCLPVGFYFIVYAEMLYASHGERISDLDLLKDTLTFEVSDREDVVQYEVYSARSKRALIFALAEHTWLRFSGTTARMAKSNVVGFLRTSGPSAIRKVLGKAVRHPIQFRRRLKKLMTAIRWIKYIAPLIGTSNKLKGNLADLAKKRKQKYEAEKQKRVRQRLFEKKPIKLKRQDAAKIIQSTWRAYHTRQVTKAVKLIRGDRQYFAVLKVQRRFRKKLAEARERIKKKKAELERLEKISNKNGKRLSDADKKRMYELQDELGKEARELLNRKLLLRPNTTFAVVWKYLFVICVIFEISNLLIRPNLKGITSKLTGEEIGVHEFIADRVVPTRVSDMKPCRKYVKKLAKIEAQTMPLFCGGNCQMKFYQKRKKQIAELKAKQPMYCRDPVASVQEGFRDVVALVLIPSEVSEWPECQPETEENSRGHTWYCEDPYAGLHSMYRSVVDFFLEEFLIFVSIVCFLDVFVTFFTGELHPENGLLIPKPFFPRWILPGLLLQLLVNPNIATVSNYFSYYWKETVMLGPVRVYRWTVAVVFPLIYMNWNLFMEHIWMPLVQYENKFRTIKPNGK